MPDLKLQPPVKGSFGAGTGQDSSPQSCLWGTWPKERSGLSSENGVGKDFLEEEVRDLGLPASHGSGSLKVYGSFLWGRSQQERSGKRQGDSRKRWSSVARVVGVALEPQETETNLRAARETGETHRSTCPQGERGQRTPRTRLGGAREGAGLWPHPCPALPCLGRHVGRAEAPRGVGAPDPRPRLSCGGVSESESVRRRNSGSPREVFAQNRSVRPPRPPSQTPLRRAWPGVSPFHRRER